VEPRPLGRSAFFTYRLPQRASVSRAICWLAETNLIEGICNFSVASQSSTPGDAPRNLRLAWFAGQPVSRRDRRTRTPCYPNRVHSLSGPVWDRYLEVLAAASTFDSLHEDLPSRQRVRSIFQKGLQNSLWLSPNACNQKASRNVRIRTAHIWIKIRGLGLTTSMLQAIYISSGLQ